MARPKSSDPLLAALIAKLPPTNTEWPVDKQMAWLNNMAMAFGLVYGGNACERLKGDTAEQPKAAQPAPPAAPPAPAPPKKPTYPFIIDTDGFARRGTGDKARVTPDQITDMIFDLRGLDGDMKTIVWADDSTGLNGRDLTIVAG